MIEKIKDTIFKFLRVDNLVENLSGYLEARIELVKIEVREEIVKVISQGLKLVLLFLSFFLFLLFFSMGVSHFMSSYLNSTSAGFWIVSCFYGLSGLILFLFRTKIGQFFERVLLKQANRKAK